MKHFASLYRSLLSTNDNEEKSNLISYYFDLVQDQEKIFSIHLLMFGKSGSIITTKSMIKLVMEEKNISEHQLKECHKAVQDWVETCSLIVANPSIENSKNSLSEILHEIRNIIVEPTQFARDLWKRLSATEIWLFNKIITGTLRPLITAGQLSKIISTKWNITPELIHLRLCLYNLQELTFKKLIDPTRRNEELSFLPYHFLRPNESYINYSLEDPNEYTIEPFICGERMLLTKNQFALMAYTINSEWKLPEPAAWHNQIPANSSLEIIISEGKAWIINIPMWKGNKVRNYKEEKNIATGWVNENALSAYFESVNNIEIKDWAIIDLQGDKIIKHREDYTKWFRIKPRPHELTVVLWYAEVPVTSGSMNMKLSLAIHNEQNELITIGQLASTEMSETDQTRLYYWIQNNTVQKFGPVRTVRPTQYFIISYDRILINKRVKLGYNLINVKIVEWLKDGREVNISKVSDIRILKGN